MVSLTVVARLVYADRAVFIPWAGEKRRSIMRLCREVITRTRVASELANTRIAKTKIRSPSSGIELIQLNE
jgi:hypothetical protein